MKKYLFIAFLVPFIFIAISFFDNFKPPLPNLYAEYNFSSSKLQICLSVISTCTFDIVTDIYWCIFLFFLPIGLSAMGNIICSCYISFPKQCRNSKELIDALKSADWKQPPKNLPILRNMYVLSPLYCISLCRY